MRALQNLIYVHNQEEVRDASRRNAAAQVYRIRYVTYDTFGKVPANSRFLRPEDLVERRAEGVEQDVGFLLGHRSREAACQGRCNHRAPAEDALGNAHT